MEVCCVGYEFSARSSVSKRGALAELFLCRLCETVRRLLFLTWTELEWGDMVSVATAIVMFLIMQLLIRPQFNFLCKTLPCSLFCRKGEENLETYYSYEF